MDLFRNQQLLENYMAEHTAPEDTVLAELTRHTYLKEVHPRMLSGHLMGNFLEMFSKLLSPFRILEIGTYTGYSAICLARGLKPGGKLTTIEINDELRHTAKEFFKKGGVQDRIEIINGDAINVIPSLNNSFDLVYIDGNKEYYSEYYQLAFEKVLPGGYLLADNVLWGGKVMDESVTDPASLSIRSFNRMVNEDQKVENQILPIRDGIMIIKKL